MDNILKYLTELNAQLKKHPDVKSVYRQMTEKEKGLYLRELIKKSELYVNSWNAFTENLKMIGSVAFEEQDENKPTMDVLHAAYLLLNYTNMDSKKLMTIIEKEDNRFLFLNTAAMLVVFCVNCQITRRISTLMDDNLIIKDKTQGKNIYRGVSNKKYTLIPTIYRNLSIGDGYGVVNSTKLRNLYINSNLLPKYKEVFGSDRVDYAFCAFAQHAKQFSPLLDFTDDYRVALSFATNGTGSINDYYMNDAALYSLSFDEIDSLEQIDFSDIDVFINENKISMFSIIRNKRLFHCTYDDFRVEAFILTDITNDRMKYQKGCFLYFKRAVIINGSLFLPINFGRIRKYTIPAKGNTLTKKRIAERIKSDHIYYLPQYLMDPYKYFEEAPL